MAHDKSAFHSNKRTPMIRYRSQKQLPLADFEWPFQMVLDEQYRWVKLSQCISWDERKRTEKCSLPAPPKLCHAGVS